MNLNPRTPRTRDRLARKSALNTDGRDAGRSSPCSNEAQPLLGKSSDLDL